MPTSPLDEFSLAGSDVRTTTKKELVGRVAEATQWSEKRVGESFQSFLDSIIDELAHGRRVAFRDFGAFEVRKQAARLAQNPRTLEKVSVPAKWVVKFKVGRMLREQVSDKPGERPWFLASPEVWKAYIETSVSFDSWAHGKTPTRLHSGTHRSAGRNRGVGPELTQYFLDDMIQELAQGRRIEFREFGVFEVRERAARMAQNPRTLEKVSVPAKRVVKFKPGRMMRERVQDGHAS